MSKTIKVVCLVLMLGLVGCDFTPRENLVIRFEGGLEEEDCANLVERWGQHSTSQNFNTVDNCIKRIEFFLKKGYRISEQTLRVPKDILRTNDVTISRGDKHDQD